MDEHESKDRGGYNPKNDSTGGVDAAFLFPDAVVANECVPLLEIMICLDFVVSGYADLGARQFYLVFVAGQSFPLSGVTHFNYSDDIYRLAIFS